MKNNSIQLKSFLSILILLVLNLTFLFYLKYSHHDLPFYDFNFLKLGNIFNYGVTVLTILGISILYFRKDVISVNVINLLIMLMFIFLLLVFIINLMNIPPREYFLLSLSFTQVLIISVFSAYQFTQFFLLIFTWLNVLKVKKYIYLRSVMNSFFLAGLYFLFTLIYINIKPLPQKQVEGNKQALAVVLGAAVWSDNKPSPTLALRVDKAAELYQKGIVSKIQLTGGNAPGELSEAEVSLKYILSKGISRDDVWIENQTTSTIEQIRYVKNELILRKKINSIIVISDRYHLQRVKEIARFYNLQIDVSSSILNLRTDKILFYQMRECVALLLFWLFAL